MVARTILFLAALPLLPHGLSPAAVGQKQQQEAPLQLDDPKLQKQVPVLAKDLPALVVAETPRLTFHVSPLFRDGILSKQVEECLKALVRKTGRDPIVKLRAFAAGRGDVRRIQAVVTEFFTERRLPLPALSVVQAGALPDRDAQVLIEAVAVSRKNENPRGLAFISGQFVSSPDFSLTVAPLAEESLKRVELAAAAAGSAAQDVLRVTCLVSSLDDSQAVRQAQARRFPQAAASLIQRHRSPLDTAVECEAVVRLHAAAPQPVSYLNPQALPGAKHYSQVAMVNVPKLALSSAQLAFGFEEKDARLAFERLSTALDDAKVDIRATVMSNVYPLSDSVADLVRKVRFEFFDPARPPASTMIPFQGLPSLDASFAVEVVAAVQ